MNYKKFLKYSKKDIINEYNILENKEKTEKNDNLLENEEEMITKINDLEKTIREKENKIEDFRQKLIDSNKKKNDLNNQISENKAQLNNKEDIINNINYKNEEFKKEINSLKSKLNEKIEIIQKLTKENENKENNINALNQKILYLNSKNTEQNNKIIELIKNLEIEKKNFIDLDNELKEKKQNLIKINKERDDFKTKIHNINAEKNSLEKDYQQMEKKEKELNDKLNDIIDTLKKEKEELNNKFEKVKNENSSLIMAIKNDINRLKELHKLGLLKNLEINDNSIKIDSNTNQIVQNKENKNIDEDIKLENFYDVVINIKSVKDISKGWEIKMTENGQENFNKYKNKELIKIGVIGNSNKGKSFILSRISKIKLPSGTSIKTEGLSIKYPELKEFKNRKIVLLDSAGLETPVLNEKKILENEDGNDEEEEIDKNNKNEINNNLENNKNLLKENANKNDDELKQEDESKNENDEKPKYFKEKSREKLITELFLQNYIIKYSDILILVVGIMTYSEQKLLNRIKTDIQKLKINKPFYIIHNLKTFYTKKQVEDYIKNNLRKSATFELKKGHNISTQIEDVDGIYYYEKNSNPKIFHLIFANEGSEAGDYYNNFTLQFLENQYKNVTDIKKFDVIQTIKERFITHSTEIIEKKNENEKLFGIDDIISNEDILKDKLIKLKSPQEIKLKRCLIDELGFSNLKGNGFEPNFNYFKKEDEKKIIVRVEAPGNSKISSKLDYSGEYTVIRLTGTKKPDKEPTKITNNLHNTREFGEFNLDIPLKTEDYNIKNLKPNIYEKKGLIILEYEYEEKSEKYEYDIKEEDEI